ncbi:MAG: DNA repair protein RadA [Oscillospiraceae bacterium]|nr:DNA repair protein RadA [Oscillospiraceae bacterium]
MAVKTYFVCTNCGAQTTKWYGRCPECGEWNTLQEETVQSKPSVSKKASAKAGSARTVSLDEVTSDSDIRYTTGIEEFDRVLGGGIVEGSVILLGGEPGAGKSTLLLQLCGNVCGQAKVLYISGEESSSQIKLRAKRLGIDTHNLLIANETDISSVINTVREHRPDLCIIDSIQTMEVDGIPSSAGSVAQVRESASALTRCAKAEGIPMIIVGHVNKDGAIAGPKVMEHIVDTVLYLEGDRYLALRILRSAKNRYGSTSEIGIFDMTDKGLFGIANPSMLLLEGAVTDTPGSCVTCVMEGSRPIMAEIQALTTKSNFSVPRRTADGLDFNRANLLIAVIEKRGGYVLSALDVYLNVIGGLNINDTASDLAVASSIVSSLLDKTIPAGTVIFGELGLGGEVRTVSDAEKRVSEAEKLGFTRCVLPASSLRKLNASRYSMELIGISNITEIKKVF